MASVFRVQGVPIAFCRDCGWPWFADHRNRPLDATDARQLRLYLGLRDGCCCNQHPREEKTAAGLTPAAGEPGR